MIAVNRTGPVPCDPTDDAPGCIDGHEPCHMCGDRVATLVIAGCRYCEPCEAEAVEFETWWGRQPHVTLTGGAT